MTGFLLPASIEAYLRDAHFTATEILVIRKMIEEKALSLRELGAKTGKSTGVLDQAVKKLLQKKVIKRELINGNPKFTLVSLESLEKWMALEVEKRKNELDRKQQDLAEYICSLETEDTRPNIQNFEGEIALRKAYKEIINAESELVTFLPSNFNDEEDPLKEIVAEFTRERRRRGMFLRVIYADTVTGHSFQSKDILFHRRTVLVPKEELSLGFEKMIVGDKIFCIDHNKKFGCCITFKEFAEAEREKFSRLWSGVTGKTEVVVCNNELKFRRKRTLIAVRKYFFDKNHYSNLLTGCLLSILITAIFFSISDHKNQHALAQRALTTAVSWSRKINVYQLERLQNTPSDSINRMNVERQLHLLNEKEDNAFEYTILQEGDVQSNQFQMSITSNNMDLSSISMNSEESKNISDTASPFILHSSRSKAVAVSPIVNFHGKVIATLLIQLRQSNSHIVHQLILKPVATFFVVFIIMCITYLIFQRRDLLKEVIKYWHLKNIFVVLFVGSTLSFSVSYVIYRNMIKTVSNQVGQRLLVIAETASKDIDARDIDVIRSKDDVNTEAYQRLFKKLNEIRSKDIAIQYVTIYRKTADSDILEFIADADANAYNIHYVVNNKDISTETIFPGEKYEIAKNDYLKQSFHEPMFSQSFFTDNWGTYVSGAAPIYNQNNKVVAILNVDVNVSDISQAIRKQMSPFFLFSAILSLLSLSVVAYRKIVESFHG